MIHDFAHIAHLRCLVLMAMVMCFALLICVVLLVFVILQHISITADKGQSKNYKEAVHVFNETINRLQEAYQNADKGQSKNYKEAVQVFNETMNRLQDSYFNLMTKKDQLQDKFNVVSDELKKYQKAFQLSSGWFFMSSVSKSWSESRQYCKDQGADLVTIKTEVKQVNICIINKHLTIINHRAPCPLHVLLSARGDFSLHFKLLWAVLS
ncbi:CD209 antigen-like protein [Labeo rohita]|uniref:CD209 antigen-like protein n=1 Tax=Labeo rohita TaxID=84645 RepID=A0A498MCU6_LABRO|nr:CD209 antigen-like protein [Labeo rohita]